MYQYRTTTTMSSNEREIIVWEIYDNAAFEKK